MKRFKKAIATVLSTAMLLTSGVGGITASASDANPSGFTHPMQIQWKDLPSDVEYDFQTEYFVFLDPNETVVEAQGQLIVWAEPASNLMQNLDPSGKLDFSKFSVDCTNPGVTISAGQWEAMTVNAPTGGVEEKFDGIGGDVVCIFNMNEIVQGEEFIRLYYDNELISTMSLGVLTNNERIWAEQAPIYCNGEMIFGVNEAGNIVRRESVPQSADEAYEVSVRSQYLYGCVALVTGTSVTPLSMGSDVRIDMSDDPLGTFGFKFMYGNTRLASSLTALPDVAGFNVTPAGATRPSEGPAELTRVMLNSPTGGYAFGAEWNSKNEMDLELPLDTSGDVKLILGPVDNRMQATVLCNTQDLLPDRDSRGNVNKWQYTLRNRNVGDVDRLQIFTAPNSSVGSNHTKVSYVVNITYTQGDNEVPSYEHSSGHADGIYDVKAGFGTVYNNGNLVRLQYDKDYRIADLILVTQDQVFLYNGVDQTGFEIAPSRSYVLPDGLWYTMYDFDGTDASVGEKKNYVLSTASVKSDIGLIVSFDEDTEYPDLDDLSLVSVGLADEDGDVFSPKFSAGTLLYNAVDSNKDGVVNLLVQYDTSVGEITVTERGVALEPNAEPNSEVSSVAGIKHCVYSIEVSPRQSRTILIEGVSDGSYAEVTINGDSSVPPEEVDPRDNIVLKDLTIDMGDSIMPTYLPTVYKYTVVDENKDNSILITATFENGNVTGSMGTSIIEPFTSTTGVKTWLIDENSSWSDGFTINSTDGSTYQLELVDSEGVTNPTKPGNPSGDSSGESSGDSSTGDSSTGDSSSETTGGSTGGSTSETTGGSTGDSSGDSSGTTGDSTGDSSGESTGDSSGSTGDSSGDSTGDSTGDSSGESTGDSSGDSSGDSIGDSTGDSSGDSTGDSSGNTSGDSSGSTSGSTSGDSSGNTSGNTSGDSSGNTSGDTSGGESSGDLPDTPIEDFEIGHIYKIACIEGTMVSTPNKGLYTFLNSPGDKVIFEVLSLGAVQLRGKDGVIDPVITQEQPDGKTLSRYSIMPEVVAELAERLELYSAESSEVETHVRIALKNEDASVGITNMHMHIPYDTLTPSFSKQNLVYTATDKSEDGKIYLVVEYNKTTLQCIDADGNDVRPNAAVDGEAVYLFDAPLFSRSYYTLRADATGEEYLLTIVGSSDPHPETPEPSENVTGNAVVYIDTYNTGDQRSADTLVISDTSHKYYQYPWFLPDVRKYDLRGGELDNYILLNIYGLNPDAMPTVYSGGALIQAAGIECSPDYVNSKLGTTYDKLYVGTYWVKSSTSGATVIVGEHTTDIDALLDAPANTKYTLKAFNPQLPKPYSDNSTFIYPNYIMARTNDIRNTQFNWGGQKYVIEDYGDEVARFQLDIDRAEVYLIDTENKLVAPVDKEEVFNGTDSSLPQRLVYDYDIPIPKTALQPYLLVLRRPVSLKDMDEADSGVTRGMFSYSTGYAGGIHSWENLPYCEGDWWYSYIVLEIQGAPYDRTDPEPTPPPVTDVTVTKTDAESGAAIDASAQFVFYKEVDGTKYYYTEAGTFVADKGTAKTLTTENGSFVVPDVPYGVYFVSEVDAPTGYIKTEAPLRILVASADKQVEFENSKVPEATSGNLRVQKVDAESGDVITSEAKFKLYHYKDGAKEWYQDDGTFGPEGSAAVFSTVAGEFQIADLDFGTYYLEEIKAPTGYDLAAKAMVVSHREGTGVVKFSDKKTQEPDPPKPPETPKPPLRVDIYGSADGGVPGSGDKDWPPYKEPDPEPQQPEPEKPAEPDEPFDMGDLNGEGENKPAPEPEKPDGVHWGSGNDNNWRGPKNPNDGDGSGNGNGDGSGNGNGNGDGDGSGNGGSPDSGNGNGDGSGDGSGNGGLGNGTWPWGIGSGDNGNGGNYNFGEGDAPKQDNVATGGFLFEELPIGKIGFAMSLMALALVGLVVVILKSKKK